MLLWPGICIVHQAFSETELLKLMAQYPGAPVAAHPECPPHIIDHADMVGSTSAILKFAIDSPADVILVATEPDAIAAARAAAGAPASVSTSPCACQLRASKAGTRARPNPAVAAAKVSLFRLTIFWNR